MPACPFSIVSSRLRSQSGLSNIHMEWLAFQIVSERFWFRDAQACDDPSSIPPGVLESLPHWLLVLCTTIACPEFTNYIMISPTPACLKYHLCESVCQSPWRVLWSKAGNIVHCPRRQIILKIVLVLSSASLTQHQYALKARNSVHCLHRQRYLK